MLYSNFISILALTAVHLGFAALLGALIQHMLVRREFSNDIAALFLATSLFVASSLSLPLSPSSRGFIWLVSVIVITLSAWPLKGPRRYRLWAWHYAGFAMSLILLWSLTQAQPIQSLGLGLSAGAAALLSLRRGFRAAKRKTI